MQLDLKTGHMRNCPFQKNQKYTLTAIPMAAGVWSP
jgi:hypothetical protein